MIKNYVEVRRTARYFLSKKIDENVKQVLFVLHGYAQNADDFLDSLLPIASEEILLVAPEGLSKFYWKDFTTNPSSSWMTSLERENELNDTLAYFEEVIGEVRKHLPMKGVTYSCIGFSQGAAMVSRMAMNPWLRFENIFLIGGGPAHDLNWEDLPKTMKFHLLYGDKDRMIKAEQVELAKKIIGEKGFKYQVYEYSGKHKMEAGVLDYLNKNITE